MPIIRAEVLTVRQLILEVERCRGDDIPFSVTVSQFEPDHVGVAVYAPTDAPQVDGRDCEAAQVSVDLEERIGTRPVLHLQTGEPIETIER